MKKIIVVIFLCALFSCGKKSTDSQTQTKFDAIVGSTKENIDNSEHAVIQFQIDNKQCFAAINQYFKDYQNKKNFPFSLWVTVETLEKNEQGHPVDTEATLFNSLEDSLIDKFISRTPFCFIGRTTRDGYRELMFYVSDRDEATLVMNAFINENTFKRKIKFSIDPDKAWESVSGFYE